MPYPPSRASDAFAPIGLPGLLLLTAVYAVAGYVCMRLAVPPGYAVPVFLPAGIALVGTLVYGPRVLLAVLAGSVVVQLHAGAQTGLSGAQWLGTLAIPPALVAQAAFGAWLARRLGCYPSAFDAPVSVLRFLLVVAPASSLIGASVAIPTLLAHGGIPAAEASFNWWSWWLGDSIGVMIMGPLALVFVGRPRDAWEGRKLAVIMPMLSALMLLVLAILQVSEWENARIQRTLDQDAQNSSRLIEKRFTHQLDMVLSLERLMLISDSITREEYAHFVKPWLERYGGIQNFGMSRWVPHEQRAAFEAAIAAQDWPGFRIMGRDAEGRTFPAPKAEHYLPIVFVEPLERNLSVVGLDPLFFTGTRAAIQRSRDSGQPAATEPIRLVQERGNQQGVVVYQMVQRAQPDGRVLPEGLISAVFRVDDLIHAALLEGPRTETELCLVDHDAPAGRRRLSGPEGCEQPDWLARHIAWRGDMHFADRNWEFLIRGNEAYLAAQRGWAAWTTLVVGLISITLLGAFLLVTSGRTRRIESLVRERTAQLESAGQRLRDQQRALSQAQRIARLGSFEADPATGNVQYSDELLRLLDIHQPPPHHLALLFERLQDDDQAQLRARIEALRPDEGLALDCRLVDRARLRGRIVHVLVEGEWQDDGSAASPARLRGIVQDVTETRATAAHMHYLAHFDALTDLPNRAMWMERAQSALAESQREGHALAVLFLDLDHFKTVNDSLGHGIGDCLLAAVAQRLLLSLAPEDVIARLGGDEFVVLLPRLERPEDAAPVARRLIEALAAPVEVGGHELSVSASIGIAVNPGDGNDVDTLLKHADTAMYGAKEGGRNHYQFFVPDMNARALERLMMETALRRAIERHELVLHYQPQVDTFSGHVVGCEALLRWHHPELGTISPAQFIPVAEKSGLIVPMGNWVLAEACRRQVAWLAAGLRVPIAVNISALQFCRADFDATVAAVLRETGADPRLIELEITESALMQPTPALLNRLHGLRRLGLTLALDDFGTGYSSLAYLKRLPISRLKLDRSFVADLPGDAEDAAIATAALSLARELGLDTVAEGVETSEQLDFLRERGCDAIQGYYFSRPLPADACETWIISHSSLKVAEGEVGRPASGKVAP